MDLGICACLDFSCQRSGRPKLGVLFFTPLQRIPQEPQAPCMPIWNQFIPDHILIGRQGLQDLPAKIQADTELKVLSQPYGAISAEAGREGF